MEETTTTKEFKQFDIISDHSDHFYNIILGSKKDSFTNTTSKIHKKIMQEWNILEHNLPESIFVRVYEGRIDLLRAVIVGPKGTPYHDGLFFFDISVPYNYPNEPPKVHYHSHGLRLNPNLYHNGSVCLSILNTWKGSREEMWNPSKSTILQILVSLQGLVLNEQPYYNEPGTKPSTSWNAYNEEVFGLSCKTMLFLLKNPPKNFEGFVAQHFRERANIILEACKAYMDGCARVGSYEDVKSSKIEVSSRFKESMSKIYEDLVVAFNKNGIAEPKQSEINENEVPNEKKSKKKRKINSSEPQGGEKKHKYWTRSKVTDLQLQGEVQLDVEDC